MRLVEQRVHGIRRQTRNCEVRHVSEGELVVPVEYVNTHHSVRRGERTYSCVFFSSSLRTCLSVEEPVSASHFVYRNSITFYIQLVREPRTRARGYNADVNRFCDLVSQLGIVRMR